MRVVNICKISLAVLEQRGIKVVTMYHTLTEMIGVDRANSCHRSRWRECKYFDGSFRRTTGAFTPRVLVLNEVKISKEMKNNDHQ